MRNERSEKMIKELKARHKKELNSMYLKLEAYGKVLHLESKYDLSISYSDFMDPTLYIRYTIKENESLAYDCNLIFEEIDEMLNLSNIDSVDQSGYDNFYFEGRYNNTIKISLCVNFSKSKVCNVEYEDVTTKKAILKCA